MNEIEVFPAPILDLPPPPENKWEKEYHAFIRLLPQLLETHRDKYVAVHEGKVVDSGEDIIELALRAYATYGYVPIYCGLVTDQPQRPIRIPSPRVVRVERLP